MSLNLEYELSRFNRNDSLIMREISYKSDIIFTGGLDMAIKCKDMDILKSVEKFGIERTRVFKVNDVDGLLVLPCKVEELFKDFEKNDFFERDWITSTFGFSPINKTLMTDFRKSTKDSLSVILGYSLIYVSYKGYTFTFNMRVMPALKSICSVVISHSDELSVLTKMNVESSTLLEFAENPVGLIDNTMDTIRIDDEYRKYLHNFGVTFDKLKSIKDSLEEKDLYPLLIVASNQGGYDAISDTRLNCLSSWLLLLHNLEEEVVSYSCGGSCIYGKSMTVNQVKELPILLVSMHYCDTVDEFVDKLDGYASLDKHDFRRPVFINNIYFDGNLSKERAIKKFVRAVKAVDGNLTDFSIVFKSPMTC